MGDLVLKTRVAVTKRNLRRIRDLPQTLSERGKEVREFLALPDDLQEKIDYLLEDCDSLISRARVFRGDDPELYDGMRNLSKQLDEIHGELGKTRKVAAKLQQEWLQSGQLRNNVRDNLTTHAEQAQESLTEKNYFKSRDEIESFFSEYVDVLRGVALRNAGFRDNDSQLGDIFKIADQLPRLWPPIDGWEWQSLAVPSLTELNRKSQAYMLRIGFPEWTIWALPFVQNEFGHVFVARTPGLATTAPGKEYEAGLLADALATIQTGPAYACAALLLRLDPADRTAASSPGAAVRSATILVTLDRIAKLSGTPPLATLTDRLRTEWRDAVAVAGGDLGAFDAAMSDPTVQRAADRARESLKVVFGSGPGGLPRPPSWAEHWATISQWAELLRDGRAGEINVTGVIDSSENKPFALVFLLDAAWLARVGPTPAGDAPEDKLDVIAAGAIQTMLEVVQDASPPPSPRSGRRRDP
jgi:hypothetical protein